MLCYLDRLLTDLAEIWYTFDLTLDKNSTKMFTQLVHRRLRKGVSDINFEGKKHPPKLKGRTLVMSPYNAVV